MVVAVSKNGQGVFLAAQPADSNALRGLETTAMIARAQTFADQAAIDAWVAALGGVVGNFVAMTLP